MINLIQDLLEVENCNYDSHVGNSVWNLTYVFGRCYFISSMVIDELEEDD